MKAWREFSGEKWKKQIDVEDFIKNNYTEYLGDSSFLMPPTEKTKKLLNKVEELLKKEEGVLDVDVDNISGINNFEAGYISPCDDVIVGLQTDKPLKRIVNPFGGMRMVYSALNSYGYKLNKDIAFYFPLIRKTHNDGVFDAYTEEIKIARHAKLITGLPDAYGRGRIIGDYRRIALYGIDNLILTKEKTLKNIFVLKEEDIRLREEVSMQIKALKETKEMAKKYGFDISGPAKNAKEATQWLYFGYLAAVKENNGAAMSLGRTSTFLDIYIERDLKEKTITESDAEEIIDNFILKLRLVRHLRTPEYNELFAGDPTWVTEAIGGVSGKRSLITKNSFRYLNSLINLNVSPEPNLTVLWSQDLPINFKKYCAEISEKTSAIQYENDDLMRCKFGSDYSIACCVSAMKTGKQMQYFGARCNLAKALLYAINGGIDEIEKIKVIEGIEPIKDNVLNYEKVKNNFYLVLEKLAKTYVEAMNTIHYMHDKYAYESIQMALHDTYVERLMAFGVAGLSNVCDSLSAIKYAKVKPVYKDGLAVDFKIKGDWPKYGNDDDRVDLIAKEVLEKFIFELRKHKLYRNAKHTLSVLTITSNVVYGSHTGATPDGRESNKPFSPGANPYHGRDKLGALASLNSVAKLPYLNVCEDGISNTFSITKEALGHSDEERKNNLISLLDGYFFKGGHHLNVNILNKEMLIDAMDNPSKYPNLTIRVSGYAVNFNKLSKKHQLEVISRTFHDSI